MSVLTRQVAIIKAAHDVQCAATVGDMPQAWTSYHELGDALRKAAVEPPQPPEDI